MIHYKAPLLAVEEVGPDGFGWAVQCLEAFFYADYGILSLSRPPCLQKALGVLTGMFYRFGLQTNVKNGGDSMPALLNDQRALRGGLYKNYDGGRNII